MLLLVFLFCEVSFSLASDFTLVLLRNGEKVQNLFEDKINLYSLKPESTSTVLMYKNGIISCSDFILEDMLCDTVTFTYLIEFHILDKGFDNFYQVLINKEIINCAIKSNKQITLNLYDFDKVEYKDIKKEWYNALSLQGYPADLIRKVSYGYDYDNIKPYGIIAHMPHYLRPNGQEKYVNDGLILFNF